MYNKHTQLHWADMMKEKIDEQDIISHQVLISMEVNLYQFRHLHVRFILSLVQINVQYSH